MLNVNVGLGPDRVLGFFANRVLAIHNDQASNYERRDHGGSQACQVKPRGSGGAKNHLVFKLLVRQKPTQPQFAKPSKMVAHCETADDGWHHRQDGLGADQVSGTDHHGTFCKPCSDQGEDSAVNQTGDRKDAR